MAKTHPKVDIVTVGGGMTASIVAAKLCPQGYDVISLEQGASRWGYPTFAHDHDSLRYSGRYAMMVDLRMRLRHAQPSVRAVPEIGRITCCAGDPGFIAGISRSPWTRRPGFGPCFSSRGVQARCAPGYPISFQPA